MSVLRLTVVVRHPETLQPVALVEGTELPDWATGLVHADDIDGGEDDTTKGYADLKVDELKAVIERRNEGRDADSLLSTEGKKADLVAVLEADDAAASGS